MIRLTALLAVAATALALVASLGAAPAAPVKLSGTVGPGETIVLKKGLARSNPESRPLHDHRQRPLLEHNFRVRVGRSPADLGHRPDRHQVDHAEPEAGPLHVRLRPVLRRHDRQLPSRQVATGSDSTISQAPVSAFDGAGAFTRVGACPCGGASAARRRAGDRPFDVAGAEEVPPGTHLVVDLPRGRRPVDRCVPPRTARPSSRRRSAADRRGRRPRARTRAAASRTFPGGASARTSIQQSVLERHSTAQGSGSCRTRRPCGATSIRAPRRLPGTPRRTDTGPVARKERRMVVHRPQARHVERVLRQLPGEAPAEHDVEVEAAQERRHVLLAPGEHQVHALRRVPIRDVSPRRKRPLIGVRPPLHEPPDRLVFQFAQRAHARHDDRRNVGDEPDGDSRGNPSRLPG